MGVPTTVNGATIRGFYRVADSILFIADRGATFADRYVTAWAHPSDQGSWSLGHYFANGLDARDDFAKRVREAN